MCTLCHAFRGSVLQVSQLHGPYTSTNGRKSLASCRVTAAGLARLRGLLTIDSACRKTSCFAGCLT